MAVETGDLVHDPLPLRVELRKRGAPGIKNA